MNFLRSLAISVGMALATSCFAMIARLADSAGTWLLPALGLSVLVVLAVAQAIGRLAKRFPSALGVRTYVKAAFGNTASLACVFLYLFMITLVAGVESNLYAGVVQQVLPGVDAGWVVAGVFAAVLAFNVKGHEFSRNIQLALVGFMLAGLFALSGWALLNAGHATLPADTHGPAALPAAAVGAFFLFVGFEWVTSSQPGSRQAAAQLPRVLLAAVAVLGAVYLSFTAAVLLHLAPAELAATRAPQLLLAAALWGEPGRWLLLAVSTAAVLMAFNAGVLGASRLVYSLARERCLPAVLGRTAANGAPVVAVAVTVATSLACSAAVRGFGVADLFANVAAVVICLCYAALLASSLRLFQRQDRRAFAVEAAALATMALLLAAMLTDPPMWQAAAVAALACLVFWAAAARIGAPRAPAMFQPKKEAT